MTKEGLVIEQAVSDPASMEMLQKALDECIDTCYTRGIEQKNKCKFGTGGICCRICHMGPCRITPKSPLGVCGADADTIAARNFLREVVGGTAAHSDHGRHLVLILKKIGEGKGGDYKITDKKALQRIAMRYHINTENRSDNEIALELANLWIGEFTSQEDNLKTLALAPVKRQEIWSKTKTSPQGIDRSCVEAMHRTHVGVDHDYKNILMSAFKTSLSDGWGGSRIATQATDILFGTPSPVKSKTNLGVLEEKKINIIVHGHEPALSDMLVYASKMPEMISYAKAAGAEGIQLSGLCCTANEMLMRHGVPVAGSFLQQELAIITGAVEMMVTDVQCVMPSLPDVARSYHTIICSTADIAKTIGATHIDFDSANAVESAKKIIKKAADNFKNRDPSKVRIPKEQQPLIAGFSVEAIKYMLGGKFRASFRPLNDAIISGRIKGIVGIVGCNNIKTQTDYYINTLTRELIKKDFLVVKTGCAAQASGKAGMLQPEKGIEYAGEGLREICETVGIPPVLHMGSCVDNTRILEAASEIVKEGGLGDDLGGLPAVGVAPEWMSEKAVAIGCYFVASGVDVILGQPFNVSGSENVTNFLHNECSELFHASFHIVPDPMDAVKKIDEIITSAREKLGINKKAERKLLDMKDRRSLNV